MKVYALQYVDVFQLCGCLLVVGCDWEESGPVTVPVWKKSEVSQ